MQVLKSMIKLMNQLEHSVESNGVGKEEGECIACQILLLTLLMEVSTALVVCSAVY